MQCAKKFVFTDVLRRFIQRVDVYELEFVCSNAPQFAYLCGAERALAVVKQGVSGDAGINGCEERLAALSHLLVTLAVVTILP